LALTTLRHHPFLSPREPVFNLALFFYGVEPLTTEPLQGILAPLTSVIPGAAPNQIRVVLRSALGLWYQVIERLSIGTIAKKTPPPVLVKEAAAAGFMRSAGVEFVQVDQVHWFTSAFPNSTQPLLTYDDRAQFVTGPG